MEIFKVTDENANLFKKYCFEQRPGLDDTYLLDEELENFTPDRGNPTYIAINDKETVGAVSLKMDDYLLRGRKGRFRIFNSKYNSAEIYEKLFSEIRKDMNPSLIDRVVLFVLEKDADTRKQLFGLGFEVERFSYLLTRKALPIEEAKLDEGFSLKPFIPGQDEMAYCRIRNIAFANLAGSETPLTPEEAAKMAGKDDYIEDGILFLCDRDEPVGIVRVAREYYNNLHYALIGPIALLPDYQKRGLGRKLLRAGLAAGKKAGLEQAILSVNAENGQAVKLYLSEGFETAEAYTCYQYFLK